MTSPCLYKEDKQKSEADLIRASAENRDLLLRLLSAFDLKDKRDELVEAMPAEGEHFDFVDILNVMASLGYRGTPVVVVLGDLDERLLPCLFIPQGGAPVVLERPTSQSVKGIAYIFKKKSDEEKAEEEKARKKAGVGWLVQATMRFRSLLGFVLLMSFALNVAALMFPFFVLAIYDWLATSIGALTIRTLVVGVTLTVLIEMAFRVMRSRALAWFASRMDYVTGTQTFSHLLHLPSFAVERASVGAQVSRLKSFEMAREFFTSALFLTLLDVPFTVMAAIALFFVGGIIGFVPPVVIGLCLLVVFFMRPRMELAMILSARRRGEAQARSIEAFDKVDSLRTNGLSEVWCDTIRELSASSSMAGFRVSWLGQAQESLSYIIAMTGAVALIYIAALKVLDGSMTSGALFASLIFYWRIMGPWQALYGNIPRLKQVAGSIAQMDKLYLVETELQLALGKDRPETIEAPVTFTNVGLRYTKNTDPVFVGLNFEAEKGKLIVLAGSNGSGKTTLLKLILGLYRPQAGSVALNRQDIRQIDASFLRRSIAYVPQVPELFDVSIAANIRYGKPEATDSEVWLALEKAGLDKLVFSLPGRIEASVSVLDDVQRPMVAFKIALARAYLKDAPLVLIDEIPNSVLEEETGANLIGLLNAWRGKKTVLLVSHREDFIRLADKVLGLLSGNRFIFSTPEAVLKALNEDVFLNQRRIA